MKINEYVPHIRLFKHGFDSKGKMYSESDIPMFFKFQNKYQTLNLFLGDPVSRYNICWLSVGHARHFKKASASIAKTNNFYVWHSATNSKEDTAFLLQCLIKVIPKDCAELLEACDIALGDLQNELE